jgi:hypothetical protein
MQRRMGAPSFAMQKTFSGMLLPAMQKILSGLFDADAGSQSRQ